MWWLVIRGTTFQPYVGVGAGGFYFSSSGQIDGRQVVPGLNTQLGLKVLATEEWGLFVKGSTTTPRSRISILPALDSAACTALSISLPASRTTFSSSRQLIHPLAHPPDE